MISSRSILCLALAIGCDRAPTELEAACRAVRGEHVTVRVGARVSPDAITGGTDAGCGDEDAARLAIAVHRILASLPEASRPPITVLLDPDVQTGQAAVTHVEVHRASGAVLVARDAAETIDRTAWLHEIAHVRMRRAPADGPVSERLLSAAEEAVADYFAATYAGTPRLGDVEGEVVRDLERPPAMTARSWASLSGVGPTWDPHRAGWALAAEAWTVAGADPELAEALVTSLSAPSPRPPRDAPAAAVEAWIERCPSPSRERLSAIVQRWAPEALLDQHP